MTPDQLAARLSATLRSEIGPAVQEPLPKTQAFMASVVLEKLGRQLQLADQHAAADRADLDRLFAELGPQLDAPDTPASVRAAFAGARADGHYPALCPFIEALYAARSELGGTRFDAALGAVRRALRARLDRQVAYAA
jgi:hypothetical protein